MSALLPILFVGLGIFGVIAMLSTWRRYVVQFGEIHRALREPLVETAHLSVVESVLCGLRLTPS